MSTTKEELVAAGIRKQIAYLEGLLIELESQVKKSPEFQNRIRDVENQLHQLRSHLSD